MANSENKNYTNKNQKQSRNKSDRQTTDRVNNGTENRTENRSEKAAGNTKNRGKSRQAMRLSAFSMRIYSFGSLTGLIARLANSFDNLAERAVVGAHGFEALTGDFTGHRRR